VGQKSMQNMKNPRICVGIKF